MYTLVDFMTHIKGVEYVISVAAIAAFILYIEILKPRPFRSLREAVREDADYLRGCGYRSVLRTAGRAAAAPFIGLAYVILLPFVCAYAFLREAAGMVREAAGRAAEAAGAAAFFGWRPREAYLGGRRDEKTKKEEAAAGEAGRGPEDPDGGAPAGPEKGGSAR